jgi:HEAT repeat protein
MSSKTIREHAIKMLGKLFTLEQIDQIVQVLEKCLDRERFERRWTWCAEVSAIYEAKRMFDRIGDQESRAKCSAALDLLDEEDRKKTALKKKKIKKKVEMSLQLTRQLGTCRNSLGSKH